MNSVDWRDVRLCLILWPFLRVYSKTKVYIEMELWWREDGVDEWMEEKERKVLS